MQNEHDKPESSTDAGGRLERLVRALPREDAARFIEQQIDWKTEASGEGGSRPHYGLCELRELMDFIYGGEPDENGEKIVAKGLGWH